MLLDGSMTQAEAKALLKELEGLGYECRDFKLVVPDDEAAQAAGGVQADLFGVLVIGRKS